MKPMKEHGVNKRNYMNECCINHLSSMNTMHTVHIYSELFNYALWSSNRDVAKVRL